MHIFFLLIILAYLGANGWIFYSILRMMPPGAVALKVLFATVFWGIALAFVALQAFHKSLPLTLSHIIYWTGTGWMAFVLYFLLFLGLFALLSGVGLRVPHRWVLSASLTVVVLAAGFVHFGRPAVRHERIALRKPWANGKPFRVVAVSDVHLGYGITKDRLRGFVDAINSEHPDAVFVGGDLVDMSVFPLMKSRMYEELRRISAPMGVYMVPGNHEYLSDIRQSESFVRGCGIRLLRDEVATLPNGIQLVGRDDRSNPRRKAAAQLLAGVADGAPVFVLDHQPANAEVEAIVGNGVDFAFFGHTHRGQFWPLSWVTDCIYAHSHGHALRGNTHIYVSTGLGLWGPPFRIGTDSEIVVVDFV